MYLRRIHTLMVFCSGISFPVHIQVISLLFFFFQHIYKSDYAHTDCDTVTQLSYLQIVLLL